MAHDEAREWTRCEKWLLSGGAGFEDGEDGARAVSFTFSGCAEVATEFSAHVLRELADRCMKGFGMDDWLRAEAQKLEDGDVSTR